MAGKIPATVVTGFPGAGKTTLIRHILEHANGQRITLIINEFGDAGVDGKAVDNRLFAHSPAAVDAQRARDQNLDHVTPLSELFDDQIAAVDMIMIMIMINKSDLMDKQNALITRLKSLARAGVQAVKTIMGALPPDVQSGQGVGAKSDLGNCHEAHHHNDDNGHNCGGHHNDFETFTVTMEQIDNPQTYATRLSQVIRDNGIVRLKGAAAVEGNPMRLAVQAVDPRVNRYFGRPFGPNETRETRLVVIGAAALNRAAITAQLHA